jgi:nucleoside-diphosphate-sugar epimerase
VLDQADYANIVPLFQKRPALGRVNCWSYVDVVDLATLIALATEASTTGHEVVYAAQPDNITGRPLSELVELAYGDRPPEMRAVARDDASGINCARARELFGWTPTTSWRDRL